MGAFILLAMMLAEPPGSDSYIFSIGGKMILAGKLPYKDFTDAKPPGIFYLYAGIESILGGSDLAIRFFDILYNIVILFFLYRIVVRATQNKNLAALSVFVYALWYSSSAIWLTAQCETFAVLPLLIIFNFAEHLVQRKTMSILNSLLTGILFGALGLILFSLKFTLVLGLFASLLFISICSALSRRTLITLWTSTISILILGSFLFVIWLKATEGYENFKLMNEWLKGYAELYSFTDLRTFRTNIFGLFSRHIFSTFSLSFIILGIFGILVARSDETEQNSNSAFNPLPGSIRVHFLLQFSAALFEIILERKMLLYHFSRSFWAFTPFIAQGIYFFSIYSRSQWNELTIALPGKKFIYRSILIASGVFFILYSPAAKVYENSATFAYQEIINPKEPSEAYLQLHHMTLSNDFAEIKSIVLSTLQDSDQIFIWGSHIGLFYHLNRLPPTIMLSDIQISSKWTSARLKEEVLSGLKSTAPRYIFVQQNDYLGFLTGIEIDSYASLIGWYDLFEFVDIYYEEKERTENFIIFERRKPEDVIAPL
jgi:hypothetical protein